MAPVTTLLAPLLISLADGLGAVELLLVLGVAVVVLFVLSLVVVLRVWRRRPPGRGGR